MPPSTTDTRVAARTVSSEDKCDGASTPEIEACSAREFNQVDRERARLAMQLVSRAVQPEPLQPFRGTLPNLKNEWRQSERAFLEYRDHACNAARVARYPGSWAGIEQSSCEISLTRAHIAFLRGALDGKGNFP